MRRFTITVPLIDHAGISRPEFGAHLESLLRARGIDGWTALSGTGVWHEYREPVAVYVIDAHPSVFNDLLEIADEFRIFASQEAIYVTAEPIETYLIREESETPAIPSLVPAASSFAEIRLGPGVEADDDGNELGNDDV